MSVKERQQEWEAEEEDVRC